ncbi:hypothetical protein [Paracoccus benzoatiresistens]|uniref:Uncharacterized protein n=1 Tax=Paracoccus benzoatiresistens TaxID=2997341 RepID=A0ABT4J653_9RHOB|nr:hypothetical protein [Paracoccus sp. EF6]MCZ0962394.1 hypothetical protein [Paracoccus sp. EF6]
MATPFHTPRPSYIEAPISSEPLTFEHRFVGLLNALAHHIYSEQFLFSSDHSDLDHERLRDSAEAARVTLGKVFVQIAAVKGVSGTDVPLYKMSLVIEDLVRNRTAPAFLRQAEESMALDLKVPGDDAAEARARRMLAAARKRILLMAQLPLYQSNRKGTDAAADVPAPQAA